MATKMSSFRLSEDTVKLLAQLSSQKGLSQADVITESLKKMVADEMPYEQKALMELYRTIGYHAEIIGAHETFATKDQPFTNAQSEVLSLLEKMWDMCRSCSLFIEEELPE